MKNTLVLTVIAAGLAVAGLARTAAADDFVPDYVRFHAFTYGGTGCPGGTVGYNITADRRVLTVLYDRFVANAGPQFTIADARKQCTLNIELEFPQGWSFSIVTADYRGYANLDLGVIGRQRSTYYFSGGEGQGSLQTLLVGPYNNDYFRRDELGLNATIWSPCGAIAPLNIRASVDVDSSHAARSASGSMTVDATDFKVEQRYGLQWRRCL